MEEEQTRVDVLGRWCSLSLLADDPVCDPSLITLGWHVLQCHYYSVGGGYAWESLFSSRTVVCTTARPPKTLVCQYHSYGCYTTGPPGPPLVKTGGE